MSFPSICHHDKQHPIHFLVSNFDLLVRLVYVSMSLDHHTHICEGYEHDPVHVAKYSKFLLLDFHELERD